MGTYVVCVVHISNVDGHMGSVLVDGRISEHCGIEGASIRDAILLVNVEVVLVLQHYSRCWREIHDD